MTSFPSLKEYCLLKLKLTSVNELVSARWLLYVNNLTRKLIASVLFTISLMVSQYFLRPLNEVLVASKRPQFLLAIVTVLLKQPTENIQFIHYEFLYRIQSISPWKSSPVIDIQSQMFSSSHRISWNHASLPSLSSDREHIDALPYLSLRRNRFVSSDDIVLYLSVTFDILNLNVSSRPMADLEAMSSIALLYGQRENNNLSVFTWSHEIWKSKPRGFLNFYSISDRKKRLKFFGQDRDSRKVITEARYFR